MLDNRTAIKIRRGAGFKSLNSIHGAFSVGTTAVTKAINGKPCTIEALVGDVWINPKGTAVADSTCGKISNGKALDLFVEGNLSLISDATGATVQIWIWEVD
jgi:hypothetical protein